MPRISDEDIRKVREAADLVTIVGERVVLRKKGRIYWGCCPFHNEKTASFKIDPATQLWHCFGCGEGGDVFGFVMKMENIGFMDAIHSLADRFNVEITEVADSLPQGRKKRLYDLCEETASFYHDSLKKSREQGAARARDYLNERGIHSNDAAHWKLGYSTGRNTLCTYLLSKGYTQDEIIDANVGMIGKNGTLRDRFYERIMFPIRDIQGRYVAFGGRVIGKGEPKYLNSQETPIFHKSSNMYGIDIAKQYIIENDTAIVVEGYTDVIAMHNAGKRNAVATLGTALTIQHVRMLSRFASKIIYLFDGDEAGMRAADRAVQFIDKSITPEQGQGRTELSVVVLPGGQDPADFTKTHTEAELDAQLDAAKPLLEFSIDRRLAKYDLSKPESRARALNDAASVLAPIKHSLLASDYANYIADRLLTDVAVVQRAIEKTDARASLQAEEDTNYSSTEATFAEVTGDGKDEASLLLLLISNPSLIPAYKDDLEEIEWRDVRAATLSYVITDADENATSVELISKANEALPQASAFLSQASVSEVSQEKLEQTVIQMVRSLKYRDIELKIKELFAKFNELEKKDGAKEETDALYKQIMELQKKQRELIF